MRYINLLFTYLLTQLDYVQCSNTDLIRARLFCCIIRDRGITPVGMLSRLGGGFLDIQTDKHTYRQTLQQRQRHHSSRHAKQTWRRISRHTDIQTYIQTDTTRETEASLQ